MVTVRNVGTTQRYVGTTHPAARQNNRAVIFRTIYESAPIARVDVAERTGLTGKTVSVIVDELLEHGLVRQIGYRETPRPGRKLTGRKAVELEVVPSSRYAIGIDVAQGGITGALVDLAGRNHHQVEDPVPAQVWLIEQMIPAAAKTADRLLASISPEEREKVVGVGIGTAGRFTARNGHRFGLPGRDPIDWIDLGPTSDLDQQLELPTYVDNHANTSALAELWFGVGRGLDNFVVLNLAVGISMGIVVGGEVYRGGNQQAGEAEHITVDAGGTRCRCGNYGCLHQYAAGYAVLQRVRDRLAAGESSATLRDHPGLSLNDIITAYQAGDQLTAAVFTELIHHLATALVLLVNTYDPQAILLGRDIATAGDPFFNPLQAEVRSRLRPPIRDQIRIDAADVIEAPVIGAATLALQEFFRAPLDQPAQLPKNR